MVEGIRTKQAGPQTGTPPIGTPSYADTANVQKPHRINPPIIHEGDTEDSSDDDISYGSDDSSIEGDDDCEDRYASSDEDMLSDELDEEVFSEDDEDQYDLGTREIIRTSFPPPENFEPCCDFDEPLYTIDEEDRSIVFSTVGEEELFTIIEESDVLEYTHEYEYTSGLDAYSLFRAFEEDCPVMTSIDEDTLFTIAEEPELEEESIQEDSRQYDERKRKRMFVPCARGDEDTKIDTENIPDLDTLISNLEASLGDYSFDKRYATTASRSSRSRIQRYDTIIRIHQDAQDHDHLNFGISHMSISDHFTALR
jgi:hypothetical protein